MGKIIHRLVVVLPIAALLGGGARAFAPSGNSRALFGVASKKSSPVVVFYDPDPAAPAPGIPAADSAPVLPKVSTVVTSKSNLSIVPVKEETVEFTAGLLGGYAGFVIGGPVLGAIAAAAANYASKTDKEVGEVISAVSKSSIEVYNYLANLDAKYEILTKARNSLQNALDNLKANKSVDPQTIKKVEDALASTSAKIKELNDEYDLVGAGTTALGVIGELVEKAVKKFGELNQEYKLTDKASEAIKTAIERAKKSNSSTTNSQI